MQEKVVTRNEQVDNNRVTITGEVMSQFEFSHEIFGEGFYMTDVQVARTSESVDTIPVMVSERLVNISEDCRGKVVEVKGQFRSYNKHEDEKNKLILSVFAREFQFIDDEDHHMKINQISLDGYVCKPPVYRKTPLGREITDLLLAVNRPYGKSDYIPCICWGRNARYASKFDVGQRCLVNGRIQSREYQKKISETETETRVAYEVSVAKIETAEGEDNAEGSEGKTGYKKGYRKNFRNEDANKSERAENDPGYETEDSYAKVDGVDVEQSDI